MKLVASTMSTPWSQLSYIVDVESEPIVRACAFQSLNALAKKAGPEFSLKSLKTVNKVPGVTDVIVNWLDGDLNAMNSLKVLQPGGEFTQECWKALRKVRGGTVISYQDLARRAGRRRGRRRAHQPADRAIRAGRTRAVLLGAQALQDAARWRAIDLRLAQAPGGTGPIVPAAVAGPSGAARACWIMRG